MKFITIFTQLIERLLSLIGAKEIIDWIPLNCKYRKHIISVIITISFLCVIFIIITTIYDNSTNVLIEVNNMPNETIEIIDDNYKQVINDNRNTNYYNALAKSKSLYKNKKIIMSIVSTSFFIATLITMQKPINFKILKATLILLFTTYNIFVLTIIMPLEIPICNVLKIPMYDFINDTTLSSKYDTYKYTTNTTSIKTADIIIIKYTGNKTTKFMFKETYTYFMFLYTILIINYYLKNKQPFQALYSTCHRLH